MLTDTQIRKAVIRDADYKLADAHGLYVLVRANGSKLWRIKYRFDKKERLQSLGPYPEVSLADAREQLQELRKKLRAGEETQEIGEFFDRCPAVLPLRYWEDGARDFWGKMPALYQKLVARQEDAEQVYIDFSIG